MISFPESVNEFVAQYKDHESQVLFNSQLPWLQLSIDAPFKEMLTEARAMNEHFVNHMENSKIGRAHV